MTAQVQSLMQLLAAANFEFPVVVFPAVDAEVGEVLEADAYFVPPGEAVAVSRRLAQILWPVGFAPDTVLPGIVQDFEAAEWREELPREAVWYWPPREGVLWPAPGS